MKSNLNPLYQVAEVKLVYKQKFKPVDRPKITCGTDSYKVLLSCWNQEIMGFIEEFRVLLLNRANRVLGVYEVSYGGRCGTICDPRVIYAAALKAAATSIILAHNHPSGNLKPSQTDIEMTRKLQAGGRLLDIEVIDHIILSEEGYYSFVEEGMM